MTENDINLIAQMSPPAAAAMAMASKYEARIAELEHELDIRKAAIEAQFRLMEQLKDARVLMRDLWRLEGEPSEELAQRCKAFMGGG